MHPSTVKRYHSSTADLSDWQTVRSLPSSATCTPSPPPPSTSETKNLRLLLNQIKTPKTSFTVETSLPPPLSARPDNIVRCFTNRMGSYMQWDSDGRSFWSVQENGLHINCLELLTGSFAIKAFVKHQSNNQVLLKIDNRSPVTHINKVEGTHSPSKPVTCSSGVCRGTSSYQLNIYQAH